MPLLSHHNINLVLLVHANIPGDVINMDKYTLFSFSVDEIKKNHCQTCHLTFQKIFRTRMYAENC